MSPPYLDQEYVTLIWIRISPDIRLFCYPVPVSFAGYPVSSAGYPVSFAGYPVSSAGYPTS